MTDPSAEPIPATPHDIVRVGGRLLALLRADDVDVGTALDALSHVFVAIVREHAVVAPAAARSLRSAADACTAPAEGPVVIEALSIPADQPRMH